jgi:hypothetical protein
MADTPDLDRVENWPPAGHHVGSVAHVHAFGQIALTSAMLEELIVMLLVQRLPMPRHTSIPLVQALSNRERLEWLRALMETDEKDTAVKELLVHAILCFDICMDNRNMLMHALYEGTDQATARIKLSKKARSDPLREIKFQVSLAELRKTAVEMGETVNFMIELWNHVRWRQTKPHVEYELPLPPLPQKPARPDRLTIPPPPADDPT